MAESVANSTASNPFASPTTRSRMASAQSSVREKQWIIESKPNTRRKFKNQRLIGEYEKPWLVNKDPRAKLPNIIFLTGMVISFGIGALLIYRAYASVPRNDFCLSFEDNFETLDMNNWNHAVQIDGFGTGSFDWTTTDPRNSYVDEQGLHIVPTLTVHDTDFTYDQIINGATLNLTRDGTCTDVSSKYRNTTCWIKSNYTSGSTIPPVRSARLTTAGKHSIKYGRVEVVAKVGKGDWLWPAIWMMPEDGGAYGAWPASGEIDIAEFRGNEAATYPAGLDSMSSTIHWGPIPDANRYTTTTAERKLKRDEFSRKFHTFGIEWTPDYMFMYVDTRLNQIFEWRFPKGSNMWNRGYFADQKDKNGEGLVDTWTQTGRPNTPFDQNFYLILNVAVGSKDKYFPDGVGGKPWTISSPSKVREFYQANATWYPTWDPQGMIIRNVKMWNLGKCTS